MTPILTAYEKQLVTDPQILIAKNEIIKKVYGLFGGLAEEYKKELAGKVESIYDLIHPKISRGENYLGLPYVVLDFPRQFGKEDIFAVRSFFWWGNFFSITLHLEGRYQQQYAFPIQNAINTGLLADWYIATSHNQWEHHFDVHNYSPVTNEVRVHIMDLPFLKLAKKIPLSQWDDANTFFKENFRKLTVALTT